METHRQQRLYIPTNIHDQYLHILLLRPIETICSQDSSSPGTIRWPAREATHWILSRLASPAQGTVIQGDVQSTFETQGLHSGYESSNYMPGKATQACVDDARIFSFQKT